MKQQNNPERISDGDLLRDLRKTAKQFDGKLSVLTYNAKGLYDVTTIRSRFGSWRKGLILAGVVPIYDLIEQQLNVKDETRAAMIQQRDIRQTCSRIDRERPCLRCERLFASVGNKNRLCQSCNDQIDREGCSVLDHEAGRQSRYSHFR